MSAKSPSRRNIFSSTHGNTTIWANHRHSATSTTDRKDGHERDAFAIETTKEFERLFNKALKEDRTKIKLTEDAIVRLHSVHAAAEKARREGGIALDADGKKKNWGSKSVPLSDLKAQVLAQRRHQIPPTFLAALRFREMDLLLMHIISYFRCHLKEERYQKDAKRADNIAYGARAAGKNPQALLEASFASIRKQKLIAFKEVAKKYAYLVTREFGGQQRHEVLRMKFFEAFYDVTLHVVKMVFPAPTYAASIEKEHGRMFRSEHFNIANHGVDDPKMFADRMGPKKAKSIVFSTLTANDKTGSDEFQGRSSLIDEDDEMVETQTHSTAGSRTSTDGTSNPWLPFAPIASRKSLLTRPKSASFAENSPLPSPDPRPEPLKCRRPMSAPGRADTTIVSRRARIEQLAMPKHENFHYRPEKKMYTVHDAAIARSPLILSILPDPRESMTKLTMNTAERSRLRSPPSMAVTLKAYARQVQAAEKRDAMMEEGEGVAESGAETLPMLAAFEEFDRVQVTMNAANGTSFDASLLVNGHRVRKTTQAPLTEPLLISRPSSAKRVWR